jgi:Tfp pilus assembly protein PilP
MQKHNKNPNLNLMYQPDSHQLEQDADTSVVVSIMMNVQSNQTEVPSQHQNPFFKYFVRFVVLIALSLTFAPLSGCELLGLNETSVKNDPSNSGSRSDRRKKEEVDEKEEEIEFTYNPIGKRDPFRSFLAFASDNSIIDNIPRTPLQRYDIEQYTLTGIISGIDRPRALVEDPTGIGHVMELGDYIGTNWGKVTSIDDDIVIITEEYKTIEDELVTRPIKLTLRTSNNSGM